MRDGSVLVAEIGGGSVARVGRDGTVERVAMVRGGPNGAAIGPDGALYVCNNGGFRVEDRIEPCIQRVDLATGASEILYRDCDGVALGAPNDLVFDQAGGFYFTDHIHQGALFYATPDGSAITRVVAERPHPNGVGLSPDEKTVYVADTETSRVYAWDIISPGKVKHEPFPAPYGGRCVCGLPGFQRFDSLALEASGNICVATLVTGYITVISPGGQVVRQVKMPDVYPTNICFGGPGLRTAYITLSASGQLAAMAWPEPGLRLNFMA
jgi:gluconolactonase